MSFLTFVLYDMLAALDTTSSDEEFCGVLVAVRFMLIFCVLVTLS